MPELPEVETIRLGLSKKIIGLKITSIKILSPKSFLGDPQLVIGKEVLNLWRRAKILGIDTAKLSLLIHLKMSGQLIWIESKKLEVKDQNYKAKLKSADKFIGGHPTQDMTGEMPNRSTRVIFTFDDGSHLYFNDQRKFGWIKQLPTLSVGTQRFIQSLGPEPLEKSFTWQLLRQHLLRRRKTAVKVAIMDQGVVSGIGNIYAAETLFLAKIDPRRLVETLTDSDYQRLYQGIIRTLKSGIKYGGSTRTHFVNVAGKKGSFLDYAYVYGREKQNCKICGTGLQKIILGGRGTVFCPRCQK